MLGHLKTKGELKRFQLICHIQAGFLKLIKISGSDCSACLPCDQLTSAHVPHAEPQN